MPRQPSDAPGRRVIRRKSGAIDIYWCADPDAVRDGFTPATVRLHYESAEDEALKHRCRTLWAEMLAWKARRVSASRISHAAGTVAWLAERFEVDPDSPFHDKREATRRFYSQNIAIITRTVGDTRLAVITGADVRRWFKNWRAGPNGIDRHRRAFACIQTLRRIVGYGAGDLSLPICQRLVDTLANMEFSSPRPRCVAASYEQIVAFREQAIAAGRPNLALAVTIQFECALRQKDVIGEWTRDLDAAGGVVADGMRWRYGLTWDQISADWILTKPLSKANATKWVTIDIKRIPELLALLQAIPKEARVGPVILDDRAPRPYKADHFRHLFREIARKAGWPDDLRNMDSRAGAITEASEGGAATDDIRGLAQHSQIAATLRYVREQGEAVSRVVDIRQARRNGLRTG